MFVASMAASTSFIVIPQLLSATPRHRPLPPSAISPSPSSSLSLNSRPSFLGGSFSGEDLKLSGRTKSGDNSRRGDGFVTMGKPKKGRKRDAFALYDLITCSPAPIYTLCVGHAWGEAALLLASGEPGHRAALPSATIMMRQPITRLRPTSNLGLIMKDMARIKATLVELYAKSTGKSPEQIEADIEIPKYFSPEEAVEYGIIDRVVRSGKNQEDKRLTSWLKTAKLVEQL